MLQKRLKWGAVALLAAVFALSTLYAPAFAAGEITPYSLLPLTETNLTLDLTDYTREQLKTFKVSDVLDRLKLADGSSQAPTIAAEDEIVWSYFKDVNGNPLDDVYHEVKRDATVDVSTYYVDGVFSMELIVGKADQTNPDNTRYIVLVTVNPVPTSFYGQLYAQDGEKNRESILNDGYSTLTRVYSSGSADADVDVDAYVAYISPVYDPEAEYYLGLALSSYSYSDLSADVYKGHFGTREEAEAAAAADAGLNVTAVVWNQNMTSPDAGYKAAYGKPQAFTVVVKNSKGVFVTLRKINVSLVVDTDSLAVSGYLNVRKSTGTYSTIGGTIPRYLGERVSGYYEYYDRDTVSDGYSWTVPTGDGGPNDEYYFRLSLGTLSPNRPDTWPANLDMRVYKGDFVSQAEITAAAEANADVDVTDSVWTGIKVDYDGEQGFTLVVKNGETVLALERFGVTVQPFFGYVSPLGLYEQTPDGKSPVSYDYDVYVRTDDNDVNYYTYTLEPGYFAETEYSFGFGYYSAKEGTPDNGKVSKAVLGHYDSLQAAKDLEDIKSRLIVNDIDAEGAGYKANYGGAGVKFTVFAEGNVHKCTVRAVKSPDGADDEARPTAPKNIRFIIKGAAETADLYIVPAEHDTYYYSGYQTLLVSGSAIDLTTVKPTFDQFTAGGAVDKDGSVFAKGIKQQSGKTENDFSSGKPVTYTAAASDGRSLKNFFVSFVKQESGPKLFVNGPDEREVYLNDYYDNRHDIFIANVGDEALTGLKAELTDAKNIKLDDYWTVGDAGDVNGLAAFTTTEKTSEVPLVELSNVAKIRLVPDGEGDIAGTLTISADGQEPRAIKLSGVAGNPKIITEELSEAVKYVPYSFLVQTNNIHDWVGVTFNLLSDEDDLPEGVTLKPNGEFYGVPRETGNFPVKVQAVYRTYDTYDNSYYYSNAFQSSEAEFTLTVNENTNENVENATDEGYEISKRVQAMASAIEQTFKSEGAFAEFKGLWLDGSALREGIDYLAEDGSTQITIRAQTFGKFGDGTHTIAAEFRVDGDEDKDLKRAAQNYTFGGSVGGGSGGGGGGGGSTTAATPATPDADTDNEQTSKDGGSGDATTPVEKFADIRGHWAESVIRAAIEKGLFNGVSETRFDANGTLSRSMIVTVLWRLNGQTSPKGSSSFGDLIAGKWYSDAIAWAAENGIVQGYADGRFGIDDAVTREQIVTILFRYAAYAGIDVNARADLSAFADAASVPSWATEAMSWAVASGLIRGRDDNTLSPTDGATRAELAAVIMRFLDLEGAPSA
jgi:hypothetical protein